MLAANFMRHVTTIKKGAYRDYLANGLIGGIIIGLLFLCIKLIQSDAKTAFRTGFLPMFICTLILFLFGFLLQEWFLRKQVIKKLLSDKYIPLRQLGFNLNNDLCYINIFDTFYIRFHYYKKYIQTSKYRGYQQDKHSVDIYCIPSDRTTLTQTIETVKDKEGVQNAAWSYGIFSIWFDDNFTDFPKVINSTIGILKQNFKPISIENWDTSYGNEQKADITKKNLKEEIQLIKWKKIEIKYKKPLK